MKLEDLKKLCDAATPGPWEHHNWDKMDAPHVVALSLWDGNSSCNGSFDVPRTYENAAFIAVSRTMMPKLLEAIEVLEIIARQDPVDPHDKPTKLGCVCTMAKSALRKLEDG